MAENGQKGKTRITIAQEAVDKLRAKLDSAETRLEDAKKAARVAQTKRGKKSLEKELRELRKNVAYLNKEGKARLKELEKVEKAKA